MDALQGALLAQAQRMPGGGAGNVGDALRWFDAPGVNDALVAPEQFNKMGTCIQNNPYPLLGTP
eukprot:COSAG03_NODE_1186_length_4618_cov_7.155344_2_plen_64_part_00